MHKRETGLRAPVAGTVITRSASTSNVTRPTASTLNRINGVAARNTSVPPNGSKNNIVKPVSRPVTRAFSNSNSNLKPLQKPVSTFGRVPRFKGSTGLVKKPTSLTNTMTNTSQNKKENHPPISSSDMPRPSTTSVVSTRPNPVDNNDHGDFKPMSSVDLDSLCRNNQNGITRMTILSTNFLDPVQRKAFLEMKRKVQQRMSVDYTRSLVANNPALLGSEAVRSALRDVRQNKVERNEENYRNVKFVETPEIRKISQDSQSTPTSRQFVERVRNAPLILQTPQNTVRKSIYTTPKRVESFKCDNRLSEGVEDEMEESPPEPTPSKMKKLDKVELSEKTCGANEENPMPQGERKERIKSLLTEFSITFNTLTFAEIQCLKGEIDPATIDSVKACLRVLSD